MWRVFPPESGIQRSSLLLLVTLLLLSVPLLLLLLLKEGIKERMLDTVRPCRELSLLSHPFSRAGQEDSFPLGWEPLTGQDSELPWPYDPSPTSRKV